MSQALDEVNKIEPSSWLYPPWEVILDPRAGTMREHTLPKIVGRARNGTDPTSGKSSRETIYGLHGPIPTPLKNPTGG
eukprot:6732419-Heterocapsa_arctica.AAC.1